MALYRCSSGGGGMELGDIPFQLVVEQEVGQMTSQFMLPTLTIPTFGKKKLVLGRLVRPGGYYTNVRINNQNNQTIRQFNGNMSDNSVVDISACTSISIAIWPGSYTISSYGYWGLYSCKLTDNT